MNAQKATPNTEKLVSPEAGVILWLLDLPTSKLPTFTGIGARAVVTLAS
jgi:hypothetical protein